MVPFVIRLRFCRNDVIVATSAFLVPSHSKALPARDLWNRISDAYLAVRCTFAVSQRDSASTPNASSDKDL